MQRHCSFITKGKWVSTLGLLVISLNQSIVGQSNKKRISHLSIKPGSSDWTRVKPVKKDGKFPKGKAQRKQKNSALTNES